MLCQQIYFMTNENISRAHLLGRFKMISIISKMIITIESGVVLFVEAQDCIQAQPAACDRQLYLSTFSQYYTQ